MRQSKLMAGVSAKDITPPLEVGLLTSSVKGTYKPFESISSPLNAKALVLRFTDEYVVIVSLDLLNLNDTGVGGWEKFKKGLSDTIAPERIIVCCTHTHCAPESGGASSLYLTDSYKTWIAYVKSQIKAAINEAAANIKPCHLKIAAAHLDGFSLQRRIKTPEGNIIMSDSVQPIAPELFDREPVDRRVNILYFENTDENAIATIVHAICHPVHEMCIPRVSSEFPGEMCLALDTIGKYGTSIFLNGAAGNTNPPTVSMGKEYARKHGQALAGLAQEKSGKVTIDTTIFEFVRSETRLAIRRGTGRESPNAIARISAIRIGSLALLFLPGEPFIETAFDIEKELPFEHIIIMGFSENNIGYIPTATAFEEGGYEAGPGKWSFLEKGSDQIIFNEAVRLLNELYNK